MAALTLITSLSSSAILTRGIATLQGNAQAYMREDCEWLEATLADLVRQAEAKA